jgi:anti-sigma factor RsiW
VSSIWKRITRNGNLDLTCNEVVELVTEFLDGGLSDDDRARFEVHVRDCRGCANYLDQIRCTMAIVGRIEPVELSSESRTELLAAFRGWARG